MTKLRPTCRWCKGHNVLADAYAQWDEDRGDWTLSSTFDNYECVDCEGETSVEWVSEEDYAKIIEELTALDPALGLLIARDRKLGVSDEEIVERIRKAVDDETRRRASLDKERTSHV
jgi:hypothetical protein